MNQDQSMIDKINRFLSEAFEVDISRMQPESNLRQVLELDSLDYIDLVVVVENNFCFKVKPEDFSRIVSFRDFYSYIMLHNQTKAPSDAAVAG